MRRLNEFKSETKPSTAEEPQRGIMTGVEVLDKRGGLLPGEATVLCGCACSFKTTLATTMVVNAASRGVPSMLISMEYTEKHVAESVLKLSDGDFGLPVFIECGVGDYEDLQAAILHASQLEPAPVRLIVVDDIRLIGGTSDWEPEELPRKLKNLATKTGAHILFTSIEPRKEGKDFPDIRYNRYESVDNVLSVARQGFLLDKTQWFDLVAVRLLKGRSIGTGSCVESLTN